MQKRKLKSYKNTSVNWGKSQAQIGKLLDSAGISDVRFTFMQSQQSIICEFNYPEEIDGKTMNIGVRIIIRIPEHKNPEQAKNQVHRALYYYLKSKFEALDFGLIEFMQEFMPHLIVHDKQGRTQTMYQMIAPQYEKGLISGEQKDIKLIGND